MVGAPGGVLVFMPKAHEFGLPGRGLQTREMWAGSDATTGTRTEAGRAGNGTRCSLRRRDDRGDGTEEDIEERLTNRDTRE